MSKMWLDMEGVRKKRFQGQTSEFKAIPAEEWDTFIAGSSKFVIWDEMLQAAVKEHSKRKLN